MGILDQRLGIQSYSFREFKDNQRVTELMGKCGLSRIELCGVHVDFSDEKTFDQVINLYHSRHISIDSVGVQKMENNEAKEIKVFEFAKRAGAKTISVDFKPESAPQSFRTAEKLADQYDVRLAIHNHGGRHWLGSAQMLTNVFSNTNERIGLCLDTAWALDSGEDPLGMIEQFGKRLYGLHIKDFVFDRAGKPKDKIVGEGNLDLKKMGLALKKINFDGYTVLEYEGQPHNPLPAIKRGVKAIRSSI